MPPSRKKWSWLAIPVGGAWISPNQFMKDARPKVSESGFIEAGNLLGISAHHPYATNRLCAATTDWRRG
jgi:hypothetical protein